MKSVFLKSASGLLEVGQNSLIRVNCNVGINSEAGRAYETERLEAIKNSDCQPDTFMDLSIGELNEPFYNEIQKRFDCPIGFVPSGGQGTGTCPNLKNQRFAYLFPHSVLSWEGLYRRSGNGQFRSFMY